MTKREMLNVIANHYANLENTEKNAAVISFCAKEIEKLDKQASYPKTHKLTAEQEAVRAEILAVLASAETPLSVKEMQAASAVLAGCSTSKISGNMTSLGIVGGKNPVENPKIVRSVEGKTAKFTIVK